LDGIVSRRRRPIPQAVDAYVGATDVWLGAWGQDAGAGLDCTASRHAARRAVSALRRFARRFPLARPAALRAAAHEQWLRGRRRRAHALLTRSAETAAKFAMPYDEALAHLELARAAPTTAQQQRHRELAEARFRDLGCLTGAHPAQVAGA